MLDIMRQGQGKSIFFSGGREFDLSEKKMSDLYEIGRASCRERV